MLPPTQEKDEHGEGHKTHDSGSGSESATVGAVDPRLTLGVDGRPDNSETSSFVAELDSGINVDEARYQFAALERRYSRMSQASNDLQRTMTGASRRESVFRTITRQSIARQSSAGTATATAVPPDVEKAEKDDEFNLADVLRTNRKEQDEAGVHHKNVGVIWEDLQVVGGGGVKINIRTFPNAIVEQFINPFLTVLSWFGVNPLAPKPKDIIHPTTGVLKPGEMCLVIGRPGSGCSSFLKAIANNREGFLAVNGNVEYAGVGAKEMEKLYAGEVLYNQEDDDHLPTLTVSQTLRFALRLKAPQKRIEGLSLRQFREDLLDLLLTMLNIKHTANTIVGNAFMRGVSGGERKRVSVAEQWCSGAALCSWDNSTRGLDASTALDYAKSLRLLTDIQNQTTFVSLYQAGEGIYDQFDKVLLLDDGHVVYFGPTKEARAYMVGLGFADMPRQTTADYLSGCTDPNERRYQEGRDATNVPSTAEELEAAYKNSDIYHKVIEEKDAYKRHMQEDESDREQFRLAVAEQKHKGVKKTSPYTVSFLNQIIAIAIRQTRLMWNDKFDLYTLYGTSITIALIVGSVFYRLPITASGAFTRGGLIFLGLLFNALSSFSELPGQMQGRAIIFRQANYRFYRPAAYAIGAVLADLPKAIINVFIFSLVLYFMGGLNQTAGAFFLYFILVFVTFMVMSCFFRTLGVLTSDYNVAARIASIGITVMIQYAGYMVPQFTMKRWLFWITYINPLYYGFEALFANEFSRLHLRCDTNYIIPTNNPGRGITGYPEGVGPNQMCSIPGSTPGQEYVSGSDYMHAAFQYKKAHIWRNWGILWGWWIFLLFVQGLAMEKLQMGKRHMAITVFKKEDKETKKLNDRLLERRDAYRSGKLDPDLSALSMKPVPFTWENLRYTVPVPGGEKLLLDDVFGYVKPGSLTALMGASGAGKTTLLDVLAARKSIGVIEGDVLMNGRPIDVAFARGCAYAEQLDVHEWTGTVREAFRFSAYLRQGQDVPKQEKDDYVEDIIELLELQDLADAMIGTPGFGLSVEARKRVTIGVELAAKPDLLLFLDEPTSGLDGQSAFNIVRFLRKLTAAGQKILCTIHQPNSVLFESFDKLLLLQRGGQTVYFGDIGPGSQTLIDYLEKNGAEVPHDANPAEFMLEAIGAGSRKRIGGDWHQKWLQSEEFAEVKREITRLKEESLARPVEETGKAHEFATNFMFQLKTVLNRTNIALWRNADYQYTRLFAHLAIGVITVLTFLRLDNSLRSLQFRIFAAFQTVVLPALVLAQIEPQYILARQTFNREASSKMYSPTVFALSQLIAEMPYSVLCSVVFFVLVQYGVGFPSSSNRAGVVFVIVLLTEVYSVTLGQALSALSPSVVVAAMFNPFLLVLFSLFCGVVAPPPTMSHFWRSWMWPLNPFTRLMSVLGSSVLHDVPVVCKPGEFQQFSPPAGQTCQQWAGKFADAMGGYLNNPDATDMCDYCQYKVGQVFLDGMRIYIKNRGRDVGIYICYVAFNMIVLVLAARYLRWQKR